MQSNIRNAIGHAALNEKQQRGVQAIILLCLTGLSGLAHAAEPAAPETTARALLAPVTESLLSSQMAGRIIRIAAKEGDRFKRGQTLIEFDCGTQKAQLEKAVANLTAAKSTHASNLRLRDFNSVGQVELDLSAAEVSKAGADVSMARTEVTRCSIAAPYDGRVAKVRVHAHDSVATNQLLIEILDDTTLEVHMYAPAEWLAWIKPGTAFQLQVDETGRTYNAKVARLGARVDPTSHSFDVIGVLGSGQEGLIAGMSGTATFSTPSQE